MGDPFGTDLSAAFIDPNLAIEPQRYPDVRAIKPEVLDVVRKVAAEPETRLSKRERAVLMSQETLVAFHIAAKDVGLTPEFLAGLFREGMEATWPAKGDEIGHPNWLARGTFAKLFVDMLVKMSSLDRAAAVEEVEPLPKLSMAELRGKSAEEITEMTLTRRTTTIVRGG